MSLTCQLILIAVAELSLSPSVLIVVALVDVRVRLVAPIWMVAMTSTKQRFHPELAEGRGQGSSPRNPGSAQTGSATLG